MLLAGDIGGTSIRLGLFSPGIVLREEITARYESAAFPSLEAAVRTFLDVHPATLTAAAFGVAGPVRQGRIETPNLPWVVEADRVAQVAGLPAVRLLNDLEANALGVQDLGPDDFRLIHPGAAAAGGTYALVSAGTGLGEAGMLWSDGAFHAIPSEGGHADFAPRTELEMALLVFLTARFGRVSYERILSGPGLVNLYEFCRDHTQSPVPRWRLEVEDDADLPAAIVQAARTDGCPLARQVLDLFVSCYGAEAGNAALRLLATGGVYLGGGIAPKIADALDTDRFRAAYTAKGRLLPLVAAIPVRIVLNDHAALRGAARAAMAP